MVPDAGQLGAFLLEGRVFALLCVVLGVLMVGGTLGIRWLGKLLKEHLLAERSSKAAMQETMGKQTEQLTRQTTLLEAIHVDQRHQRETAQATALMVGPWGSPDWLKETLRDMHKKLDDLRLEVAKRPPIPPTTAA